MRVVYSTTRAVLAHGGQRIQINPGETWNADDPLVAQYPGHFADHPRGVRVTTTASGWAEFEPDVEQATRAPGERRTTRRPRG